ncbi:hypothetical protein CONPUDRAFT_161215 [Coniophora puteana RWD-64-598 SS2]|uniref:Transcriptional activator Myb n=1 Tax=Coniophora puteana (strain RWD-64-598) TaxID=741705 RepID=A0A5M3N504_CONPW|nr:uncharacterized protein CONPUDRAFT_161215 [Coniophora puteana RWD-64-598 SS2]EIW86473.1 hypothetical protein CONPUDRAFT_161215 [Coniophora puteana RWD-64-598 SS2]
MERSAGRPWTANEDDLLVQAVALHGESDNWKAIARAVPGRTNKACRKRWLHSLSPNIRKSAWTPEEDRVLLDLYKIHHTKWSVIARHIPGRTDDACSKRYREALDPSLKRDEWTQEEDDKLAEAFLRLGGRWGVVGQELQRSGLACRNRWRLLERKRSTAMSASTDQRVQQPLPSSLPPSEAPSPLVEYQPAPWSHTPVYSQTPQWDIPSIDDTTLRHSFQNTGAPLATDVSFQYSSSSLSSALSSPHPSSSDFGAGPSTHQHQQHEHHSSQRQQPLTVTLPGYNTDHRTPDAAHQGYSLHFDYHSDFSTPSTPAVTDNLSYQQQQLHVGQSNEVTLPSPANSHFDSYIPQPQTQEHVSSHSYYTPQAEHVQNAPTPQHQLPQASTRPEGDMMHFSGSQQSHSQMNMPHLHSAHDHSGHSSHSVYLTPQSQYEHQNNVDVSALHQGPYYHGGQAPNRASQQPMPERAQSATPCGEQQQQQAGTKPGFYPPIPPVQIRNSANFPVHRTYIHPSERALSREAGAHRTYMQPGERQNSYNSASLAQNGQRAAGAGSPYPGYMRGSSSSSSMAPPPTPKSESGSTSQLEQGGAASSDTQPDGGFPGAAGDYPRGGPRPRPRPMGNRRRPDLQAPLRLSSDLPATNDPNVKPYACGHETCWPAEAKQSSHMFRTSRGLSDHNKAAHPDDAGGDRPYRCGLEGCGKSWKSINGLQYHLQISKAHFQHAISTTIMRTSFNASVEAAQSSASSGGGGSPEDGEDKGKKQYVCPHDNCFNRYKQLSGLRYHLAHGHPVDMPVQLDLVPPALSRRLNEKLQASSGRAAAPRLAIEAVCDDLCC